MIDIPAKQNLVYPNPLLLISLTMLRPLLRSYLLLLCRRHPIRPFPFGPDLADRPLSRVHAEFIWGLERLKTGRAGVISFGVLAVNVLPIINELGCESRRSVGAGDLT